VANHEILTVAVFASPFDLSMLLTTPRSDYDLSKKANIVFSPLSIQIALSLIVAGSSGPTLDQLLGFLKFILN